MAKDCWSKERSVESNTVTSKNDDVWEAKPIFTAKEGLPLMATTFEQIDYGKDWSISASSFVPDHRPIPKELLSTE